MSLYMTQFTYTTEAWKALVKNPEDRGQALSALAERMGGQMLALYYCFGEYDGVTIFEAPDETTAAAVLLAVMTPGHIASLKTTVLLTIEETMDAMRKAGTATYRGPRS